MPRKPQPRDIHNKKIREEKQRLRELEREARKLALEGPFSDDEGDDMIETVDDGDEE